MRRTFIGILFIFGLMVLSLNPLFAQEKHSDKYEIGIGDIIEVQVWKEPDLSRTQAVRLDGRISLPLVGDIKATEMSTAELKKDLEKRFSQIVTEPAVSVLIVNSKSKRYYVLGQVNEPGEFSLDYPLTILQAIARSGGFKEWAKKDEIRVFRRQEGNRRLMRFDYESLEQGDDLKQNFMISPGDTVIVP